MGRPEDSRVKIPALVHFTRLGYTYMSIKDKERNVDYDGDTNIFYSQFLSAVNRINQTELTLEDAKKIIGELKIKLDVTIQYPVKYILIFRQNRENKISVSSSF